MRPWMRWSSNRRLAVAAGLGLSLLMTSVAPRWAHAQQRQTTPFPVYPGLEPAVEFWKSVYSKWSENDVVFHDRDDLSIVYDKIRQEKSDTPERYRANETAQEAIVQRYRRILLDLAARNPDPRTLSGDYEEVYEAFGGKGNPARWRQAADRIRVQRGLRERFHRGLLHAGQYRPHILRVLREEGVPEQLAWLPMVEECADAAELGHAEGRTGGRHADA